nr:MAG TPA: hypothetical protein [Caudoviricetes sp.]
MDLIFKFSYLRRCVNLEFSHNHAKLFSFKLRLACIKIQYRSYSCLSAEQHPR